jgi:hypothetical protein
MLGSAGATAAETCPPRYPSARALAAMFDQAERLEQALEALKPESDIVLLARGGQDLSRFGLRHSHLAFALREADGHWRVVHELNRCKTDQSSLYREGLANFIGESALASSVRVGVFEARLRERLKALLAPPAATAHGLHEPRYSAIAYPFATRFQNSNQWVLEVLAAAAMPESAQATAPDRAQAQQWLRQSGYQPSKLPLKLRERIGARFFVDSANTIDHPVGERVSGNYSVVTVESVFDFLQAENLLAGQFHLKPDTSAQTEANP